MVATRSGEGGAKWVRGVKKYNFQWPSSKSLQTPNAGEGVEKENPPALA